MPDRPLTILQVTHQGGPAGSTQSIFGLSQHLARRGHRVVVGCREDALLARLAREAALPVVPLAFAGTGVLGRSLAGVIARERVDVVNANATREPGCAGAGRCRRRSSSRGAPCPSRPRSSSSPWDSRRTARSP